MKIILNYVYNDVHIYFYTVLFNVVLIVRKYYEMIEREKNYLFNMEYFLLFFSTVAL